MTRQEADKTEREPNGAKRTTLLNEAKERGKNDSQSCGLGREATASYRLNGLPGLGSLVSYKVPPQVIMETLKGHCMTATCEHRPQMVSGRLCKGKVVVGVGILQRARR